MSSWVPEQTGKFINYTSVNEAPQRHFSLLAVSAKQSRPSEKPSDPEIELLIIYPVAIIQKKVKKTKFKAI